MKIKLCFSLIFVVCVQSVRAQQIFTDPRDNTDYPLVTMNGQRWFAKNIQLNSDGISSFCPDEQDCSTTGRFYHWDNTFSICPSGWTLPSIEDMLTLIENLNGTPNSRRGKLVHRKVLDKFRVEMAGLYFSGKTENPLSGKGIMEIWLSSSDTTWNNPDPQFAKYNGQKVLGLHIYRQSNDSLNVEPTYIDYSSDLRVSCRCIEN